MKSLIKKHDSSLNTIKAHFDELRYSLESVRSAITGVARQEYEDLRKIDAIVTQLKERWEAAVGIYGLRRSNLKKCLYTYHEHIKALNNEKLGSNLAETKQQQQQSNKIVVRGSFVFFNFLYIEIADGFVVFFFKTENQNN